MPRIINEQHSYVIDRYPLVCQGCPFLVSYSYRDNAYYGIAYYCKLGYMEHGDTREFDISHKRWKDCKIESDPTVVGSE